MTFTDAATFYAQLPTMYGAAAALFTDETGRVLLVKPNYRDHWSLPGGIMEAAEPPRDGCAREVAEELGLTIDPGELLVVDWVPPEGDRPRPIVHWVYDGGTLTTADAQRIKLQEEELDEFRFIAEADLGGYLPPVMTARVRTALRAKSALGSVAMSLASSFTDAGHLAVAVGLTYALGFERDLRGAPTGDRVFALIGAGAGAVGIIAAHGAPNALAGAITGIGFIGGGLVFRQSVGRAQVVMGITTAAAIFAAAAIGAAAGQGRLLVATAATLLALFVLEIRHIKILNVLDGRHWADRFGNDDPAEPPDGH